MGTEYYLVKPQTKELFYLGKRLSSLNGVPTWIHTQKADYAKWETVDDVFLDIFENSKYFLEGNMKLDEVWDMCWAIYDWCDSPVYLDNDCNDNNVEWREWSENCSIYNYLETEDGPLLSIIKNKIPTEYWIETDQVIDTYKTLLNFIELNIKEKE